MLRTWTSVVRDRQAGPGGGREFAAGIHAQFRARCWRTTARVLQLEAQARGCADRQIQRELARWLPLPVHHARRFSRAELLDVRAGARYKARMSAYCSCSRQSSRPRPPLHRHQAPARGGAGYFDAVTQAVTAGTSSITALSGSTEEQQFEKVALGKCPEAHLPRHYRRPQPGYPLLGRRHAEFRALGRAFRQRCMMDFAACRSARPPRRRRGYRRTGCSSSRRTRAMPWAPNRDVDAHHAHLMRRPNSRATLPSRV